MSNNYVEIKTKRVEFEPDSQEGTNVTINDAPEGMQDEQHVLDNLDTSKPVQPEVQPKDEKRKERAKARIKQLLEKERQANERAAKAEAEKEELRKQLMEGRKEDKTALKSRLEANVAMLTKQMTDAIKNGDAEATVVYQEELINAKVDLSKLNDELETEYKEVKAESEQNTHQQQRPSVPERALEWIEDHPAFKTDELFQNAALVVNNQLLREGYNAEEEDFYEELDARLSKRFPEVFGMSEQNRVESNQVEKSKPIPSEPEVKDVKETSQTSKVRISEQTVSGSSRPSANSITKKRTTSVDLSPADIAQAERWGISLEQMARRIAHAEQNKRNDGYVPIHIPSKQ